MKDAFDLHVLPKHLTSSDGEIVPINSIWLKPNETYTLNDHEHDKHEKEKRALGEYKESILCNNNGFVFLLLRVGVTS